MRVARWVLVALVALLAAGPVAGVAAQDDGVGFEDMPGLQLALLRTFSGEEGVGFAPGDEPSLREYARPKAWLALTGVYQFDTEANAAGAMALLQTDMNATGMGGQPLPLTDVTLRIDQPHAAAVAKDTTQAVPVDFTLAIIQDGVYVYTVIAITTGAPAVAPLTAVVREMIAAQPSADAPIFAPDGTSSGGVWAKIPTREALERHFRGVIEVTDTAPFAA